VTDPHGESLDKPSLFLVLLDEAAAPVVSHVTVTAN
jgi:hypothetical protein